MKILQLTSDWKWTGPAAPMLQLLVALRKSGHDVDLACPATPIGADASVEIEARKFGVEPALLLTHSRGVRWFRDTADALALRALIEARGYDIIHTWHTRDHVLALRAVRGKPRGMRARVVRSYKSAQPIRATPWNRWLFGPGSDGLVCVSPVTARANSRLRGGRPTLGTFGAVDLERFLPGSADKAVRESLGLTPGQRVVGIVARAQRHRRFDLLLEAAARLFEDEPDARLLIIGRGTHIHETAEAPAERLGIADRVIFAGYRTTDYVDVLRSIDVFTLLVPGSDGGCRAVLEAAACGVPAVTTGRGALPELIVDGQTGRIVPERTEALAGAWRALLTDEPMRMEFGRAARCRAEAHFSPEHLCVEVESLYRSVLRGQMRPAPLSGACSSTSSL